MHTWIFSLLASLLLAAMPAAAQIAPLKTYATPQPLPEIQYMDATGALKILDTSGHKLTILHMWATWCVPCIAELPEVDAVAGTYAGKGLRIVALSMDNSVEKVRDFYTGHHIAHLPSFLDPRMAAFRTLKLRGLPATYFLNEKGEAIARIEGPADWKAPEITALIKKHLP